MSEENTRVGAGIARPRIIAIVGANASGKSGIGIALAKKFGGEVISADSRQIYRGFDLCSGKVTAAERAAVRHHLIDIVDIGTRYSVADYQAAAYSAIGEICEAGKLPVLVGGTGLYADAVTAGYDLTGGEPNPARRAVLEAMSEAALREEIQNRNIPYRRDSPDYALTKHRMIRIIERFEAGEPPEGRPTNPRCEVLTLSPDWEKTQLYQRIEERLNARIRAGMVAEVKDWLDGGGDPAILENLGLEFRYISRYLRGCYKSETEFTVELGKEIRHFAKRQLTWFRRNNSTIPLDMSADGIAAACAAVDQFLSSAPSLSL